MSTHRTQDESRAVSAPPTIPLIEEGAAFVSLGGPAAGVQRMDVVVIGAGQAGLSVGYHLARQGLRFAIFDAEERVGDVWRRRWDSLRLFTPAKLDGLVGMPFPAPPNSFPTKEEMAAYLEAYAARFHLPVRTRSRVKRLSRAQDGYVVETDRFKIHTAQVVVAMASYQTARIPTFARELREDVVQLHSTDYRNPTQLRAGGVLVVGAGNSGAEIAMEVVPDHRTFMSGTDTGHVPFNMGGLFGRLFLARLVLRFFFHRVLTIRTPIGRKLRPKLLRRAAPLIRVKPKGLAAAGVVRVARMVGVRDGLPLLEDGQVVEVANVIWCTGFDPGFSWIDLPIFDHDGEPRHEGGVVAEAPGLYFVGLHFLYAFSSTMIHGVGRDARRIADAVAHRATHVRGAPSTMSIATTP